MILSRGRTVVSVPTFVAGLVVLMLPAVRYVWVTGEMRGVIAPAVLLAIGGTVLWLETRWTRVVGDRVLVHSLGGTVALDARTTRLGFRIDGSRYARLVVYAADGQRKADIAFALPGGPDKGDRLVQRFGTTLGLNATDNPTVDRAIAADRVDVERRHAHLDAYYRSRGHRTAVAVVVAFAVLTVGAAVVANLLLG